jgi:nicotinate phosphoribosyltransferase
MIEHSLLLTDLYELSMLEAYAAHGMAQAAVFELFARKLPAERGFLMAAGLQQAVEFLESVELTADELAWLRASGSFTSEFIDSLAMLRFTGDVDAMPEGTVFFPDEPVLRVTAPLPEAQLVETRLLNLLHFQTIIASKAARIVLAAPGKQLVDFGLRRAHGDCWRHARAISRALPERPRYWLDATSVSRSLARWPTPSCRRTTMRRRPSNVLPASGRTRSRC